jgi:ribose 5-phosphate isomerase B
VKIAIACDHAGFETKAIIKEKFPEFEWIDLGTDGPQSVNYPDYGHKLAQMIEAGDVSRGVLICGTGIGISLAANRHKGVRAALCTNSTMARLSRQHNDANVIALGSRVTGIEIILDCVETFMAQEFEGGRHQTRVDMIETDN